MSIKLIRSRIRFRTQDQRPRSMAAPWQFQLSMALGRIHPSKAFRERVLEPVFYELLEEYVQHHDSKAPFWLRCTNQLVWTARCGVMLYRLVPAKAQIAIASAATAAIAKHQFW